MRYVRITLLYYTGKTVSTKSDAKPRAAQRFLKAHGQRRRQQNFEQIAGDERQHAGGQACSKAAPGDQSEPERAQCIADRCSCRHGEAQGTPGKAQTARKLARCKGAGNIAEEKAARGPEEHGYAAGKPGKNRHAHRAQRHIAADGRRAPAAAQQRAAQMHAQQRQAYGHRRQGNLNLGKHTEQRAQKRRKREPLGGSCAHGASSFAVHIAERQLRAVYYGWSVSVKSGEAWILLVFLHAIC